MLRTKTANTPAERMTRARTWIGLDQTEMGEILGYSRNTISNWERGISDPPFTVMMKWGEITGRSLDWIARGDESEEAPADAEASRLTVGETRLRNFLFSEVRPKGFEPLTF